MNDIKPFVDDYLPYLLARSSKLVSEQFHATVKAAGVNVNYWRILASLSDGDGLTLKQLNQRVLFNQPTLSKLVTRMETEGLLERHKDTQDKRAILIYISAQGRDLVDELLSKAKWHEDQVLANYSAQQQDLMKDMLRQLVNSLES
jgi:MarR family transcriptional regulator, organic hydroperoxide resistance regulator